MALPLPPPPPSLRKVLILFGSHLHSPDDGERKYKMTTPRRTHRCGPPPITHNQRALSKSLSIYIYIFWVVIPPQRRWQRLCLPPPPPVRLLAHQRYYYKIKNIITTIVVDPMAFPQTLTQHYRRASFGGKSLDRFIYTPKGWSSRVSLESREKSPVRAKNYQPPPLSPCSPVGKPPEKEKPETTEWGVKNPLKSRPF